MFEDYNENEFSVVDRTHIKDRIKAFNPLYIKVIDNNMGLEELKVLCKKYVEENIKERVSYNSCWDKFDKRGEGKYVVFFTRDDNSTSQHFSFPPLPPLPQSFKKEEEEQGLTRDELIKIIKMLLTTK